MLIFDNASDAFEALYTVVMANGKIHDTANCTTKALYNIGITIEHPENNIINTKWRKWSERYAEREWQWYLSGNPSVEEIKKFAPTWDKMHGGDNIVNSNYGYQWNRNDQLKKCIEQLKSDNSTRQAWISIYDGKEKDLYKYDTPCTMCIGFDVINDKLNMTVVMRSNDLVFGFCNDQYCFSKLQSLVAKEIGVTVGTYYHFVHNLHIYDWHWDLKKQYLQNH